MKTSAVKLLKTVDTVTNALMVRQQTGANASTFLTDTMTVAIQKLSKDRLSTASYSATGPLNSRGDFTFPDIAGGLMTGQDYGIKVKTYHIYIMSKILVFISLVFEGVSLLN